MPNLTIYVPEELAREVRAHQLPVSAVCQAALRRKVRVAVRLASDPVAVASYAHAHDQREHRTDHPA